MHFKSMKLVFSVTECEIAHIVWLVKGNVISLQFPTILRELHYSNAQFIYPLIYVEFIDFFIYFSGVAVDDQGYICVADSGNNRIQIFHPDGSFLRAFGSWGSGDAEFKGLEGVAIMSNGNILVCDRENHRVQVF